MEPMFSTCGALVGLTLAIGLIVFRVTPAYQYDVFLEHPLGTEPKPATVAQRIGEYSPKDNESWFSVLPYDTRGTEHKGFRYDERHPNGK